ncbi:MAG TPA: hypothetical protein PLK11_00265 [Methanofastidiosum sp.]|nr:hypothetical protein [Methanofastidiosum sp.]HNV94518.1 hypothetical protein [Methanofastidiosum sp.]HOE92392.1 hypothetical protein [Methanofastidiosum sp.]HOR87540.1 hypothetical protein [Methanofastidiosum sp.]HOT85409.1 hypothetical protein [Methanofastidiosum sp.]
MKKLEIVLIVILMAIPFFFIKTQDFTTFIYWSLVTLSYLIYILFSTKRWVNE